jgi:hypothetical protein
MEQNNKIDIVLWTDAQRAARDGQIIDRMAPHVHVVGVGGPRTTEIDALSRRLDCPHDDDLRKLIVSHPGATLMLGSAADIQLTDDTSIIALDLEVDTIGDLAILQESHNVDGAGQRLSLPGFMRSAGWSSAADPIEVTGAPQLVSVISFGHVGDCSLAARLMDGWRTVLSLSDMPESIDASLAGPLGASVPQSLFGLTGHMAGHARLPGGGVAMMQASDCAVAHLRQLHVVGKGGRLAVDHMGYQLFDVQGNLVDQTAKKDAKPRGFIDLVVDDWQQSIRLPKATTPLEMEVEQSALACCLASLLSARTGEPESPAKLIEMQ